MNIVMRYEGEALNAKLGCNCRVIGRHRAGRAPVSLAPFTVFSLLSGG